jgi:hypothetical protein
MNVLAGFFAFAFTIACGAAAIGATVPIKAEDERFTIEVKIEGRPQRFVVDTAATNTFMAAEAAKALGLSIKSNPQTGDTVTVRSYTSALFERINETITLVPRTGMSVADGVVGMDLFVGQRVAYDFEHTTFSVTASEVPPAGFVAIPITLTAGTLAVAEVLIDGVKVKALIDGGARHTIGNPLLQIALGFKDGDPRLSEDHPVPGPKAPAAQKATVGRIELGSVHIDRPVVSFAALGFFKAVGLDNVPAVLLGSDLQRKFKIVAIDYGRTELQVRE